MSFGANFFYGTSLYNIVFFFFFPKYMGPGHEPDHPRVKTDLKVKDNPSKFCGIISISS